MLLLTALLVGACFAVGQAVLVVCGWRRLAWWAPAVGYGVLLIVGGQAIRIPHRVSALVVLAVALSAVVVVALPSGRRALREVLPDGLVVGLGLILLAAIPFFATGHAGVLGATLSDDMSQHLTAAFFLRTGEGMKPVAAIGGDLITTGYPLGPHGLVAALTRLSGLGEERVFSAVTLVIPALTGLATLGLVPNARRPARWALAAVVGLGYLPAAYLAQGSFKEITEALFVLATAVALMELVREERPLGLLRAVPLGLMAGATVYSWSYGGVVWIGGVVGVLLVAEVVRRPRVVPAIVRRGLLPAIGAGAAAAVVIAPELHRIRAFRHSIFGQEPLTNTGNLFHALNPLETVGQWFSGEFRVSPTPRWPSLLFTAIALAALAGGLAWWWRRRSLALPAAVVASIAIWVDLAETRNIYNAAKGLVVIAPVLAATIGAPLAAAWGTRGRTPRGRNALRLVRVVGVVLFAGAAVASGAMLRSAPVGLGTRGDELAALRPLVLGKSVLFLSSDHFAQWELRGAKPLYVTNSLYSPGFIGEHPQKRGGVPVDVDNFGSRDLDKVRYIVNARGRYTSEIPPNFRLVRTTPSFALYKRHGRTPEREPVELPGDAGAVLDCHTAQGKFDLAKYKWAGVLPTPLVRADWQGSMAKPGQTASMRVTLPSGRWDVSLQFVSPEGLRVRGPALDHVIAASYGLVTTYWPAGTLTSDGSPFTLSVTAQQRTWFGRLLGLPRPARSPNSPGAVPLWHVAFTRHGSTPRRTRIRSACGRYVDWIAPGGGTMRGR